VFCEDALELKVVLNDNPAGLPVFLFYAPSPLSILGDH